MLPRYRARFKIQQRFLELFRTPFRRSKGITVKLAERQFWASGWVVLPRNVLECRNRERLYGAGKEVV